LSHFISFIRIPALAIRQSLRPLRRLDVLEEDHIRMHVWPQDIDFNLHMNNARYLSVMDYGRMHLLARTRLLDHALRSRWQPIVGAVWMTYRRSLPLFSAFTLSRVAPGIASPPMPESIAQWNELTREKLNVPS
jgi:hypothetical protein